MKSKDKFIPQHYTKLREREKSITNMKNERQINDWF